MAINDDMLERDPRLARLMQLAADEEPPAALDAAILAAARREAGARPQLVGGGGETSGPPVRAKRNWYVPVSIAAVLVLSVSLVTLVHEEKGDELAQPPRSASAPPKLSAPVPAAEAPAAAAPESAKADALLRDAAPAKPKVADAKRTEAAAPLEVYSELAKKQRMPQETTEAGRALVTPGTARKDQAADVITRERRPPVGELAAAPQATPSAQAQRELPATGPQDRPATETRREPEASGRLAQERQRSSIGIRGFDSGTGAAAPGAAAGVVAPRAPSSPPQESKASPQPFPGQASRDVADERVRSEADRNLARSAKQEALASAGVPSAPPAPVTAAPRRAAPGVESQVQPPPPAAESRPQAAPPPPPAAKPAQRRAEPLPGTRPLWLRELENQPPEKWLEKLAEFKRDGRQADADELLAEFRRRFPDHPASAR